MEKNIQINLKCAEKIVNLFFFSIPNSMEKNQIRSITETIQKNEALFPITCKLNFDEKRSMLRFTYMKYYREGKPSFSEELKQTFRDISKFVSKLLVQSQQLIILRECKEENKDIFFHFAYTSTSRTYDVVHQDKDILTLIIYVNEMPVLSTEFILMNKHLDRKEKETLKIIQQIQNEINTSDNEPHAILRTQLPSYSSVIFLNSVLYHSGPISNKINENKIKANVLYTGSMGIEEQEFLVCKGRIDSNADTSVNTERKYIGFLFTVVNPNKDNILSSIDYTVNIVLDLQTIDPCNSICITTDNFKNRSVLEEQCLKNGYLEHDGEKFFFQS